MAIKLVSLSPIEAEAYASQPRIRDITDRVANMIQDLHEEEAEVTMLLAMNDPDNQDEFTLAFGGTTLSLEVYPDRLEVVEFNDGDELLLEIFDADEFNKATLWLVNHSKSE